MRGHQHLHRGQRVEGGDHLHLVRLTFLLGMMDFQEALEIVVC